MRIADLSRPVSAAKTDWLPIGSWVGFTPTGKGGDAFDLCRSAIVRQAADGYILERITQSFETPNEGFADEKRIAEERRTHAALADGLVAIHRIRPTAKPLREIVGDREFDWLQDAWANAGRRRWSVAFPVVESFNIVGAPKAHAVFSEDVFGRHFRHQSGMLRPLSDEARRQIADLELEPRRTEGMWIEIEQDALKSELSEISSDLRESIALDLRGLEGMTQERLGLVRARAAWIANAFIKSRRDEGTLHCDVCRYHPSSSGLEERHWRSLLDVHHLDPLAEGMRLTGPEDFALLCPNCHRIEHVRIGAATA